MNRKAIIIVTPAGANLSKLDGAEKDALEWQTFLKTPEGGAWRSTEIEILRDPTKSQVDSKLASESTRSYDFVLLAFSGHGEIIQYSNGNRENRMYLSYPSDYITDKSFKINGQRELVCLDACREVSKVIVKKALDESVALAAANSTDLRMARSREMFDEAIRTSPLGRTVVYSCDINQTASDNPSFTQTLIDDGSSLARATSTAKVLTIKEVFDVASPKMTAINYPQKPVYEGGRRITHLPFVVSI